MFQRHLLKDTDVEPLAQAVFKVLDKVGIMCQNEEILRALKAMGAKVDLRAERVTFPKKMQQTFVEQIRKEQSKRDTNAPPKFTPPGLPGLGTQVAQFYHDFPTKERRSGNKQDLTQLIKFGDALHGSSGVGHCLLLTDVPPLLEPLEAALLLAEYAHEPQPAFAWHVRTADYLIEMGEILGIKKWFSYGANCFAHPLRLDKDVADKFVRRVREGEAAGLAAMPVVGVSAPVTLAGFIAVTSAEFLAVWMAGRAVSPRASLGGSMWTGTMDMHTGEVSYCAPDAMFYAFATVEFLRRWCGMDVAVGGGEYCSAKEPGLYAALEKAYKAMTIAAFSGRHPSIGQGMLDDGKVLSPVQLLVERDLSHGLGHFARPLELTPEASPWETILDVGVGIEKNYLESEHTLRHFRQCLWLPEFIQRSGWSGGEQDKTMLANAQKKVEDLTAQYRKPEVDPDKLARMRKVVERARKELLS